MTCKCKQGFICKVCCPDIKAEDVISADARYIADKATQNTKRITGTLWGIFVVLPIVLGILFAILK
jgi:hypothetical protein